jgi:hypothetical protein
LRQYYNHNEDGNKDLDDIQEGIHDATFTYLPS